MGTRSARVWGWAGYGVGERGSMGGHGPSWRTLCGPSASIHGVDSSLCGRTLDTLVSSCSTTIVLCRCETYHLCVAPCAPQSAGNVTVVNGRELKFTVGAAGRKGGGGGRGAAIALLNGRWHKRARARSCMHSLGVTEGRVRRVLGMRLRLQRPCRTGRARGGQAERASA